MLIRILTSREGHPCGAEVEVPDEQARAWIGVGDAEAIPVVKTPALETAMKAKAKGR